VIFRNVSKLLLKWDYVKRRKITKNMAAVDGYGDGRGDEHARGVGRVGALSH